MSGVTNFRFESDKMKSAMSATGALSGQPGAWTAYADALKAQLVHLPDAPGPTGGWRCKAQVVRALADLGPSCAHPVPIRDLREQPFVRSVGGEAGGDCEKDVWT